jgi:hypothetical protein
MTTIEQPPTSDELWEAYRKSCLRYRHISFYQALNNPLLYKSLTCQVDAIRKKRQQNGTPAPIEQAA